MSLPGPIEQKRPSFWRRPVPMWAFVFLIIVLVLLLFIPSFLISPPPTIQQSLILSQDSRILYLNSTETTVANFTVTDLNVTNSLPATVAVSLTNFSNGTPEPPNSNVTLTVRGVYAGNSFTQATGNKVSFQPGGNTLVIDVKTQGAKAGLYTITVGLS